MDYRALGELIFFSLIGLSVLTLVTSLSFHFVLRPFLENVLVGRRERGELESGMLRRLEAVEGRVVELEGQVDRVRSVQDFERQLRPGTPGGQQGPGGGGGRVGRPGVGPDGGPGVGPESG